MSSKKFFERMDKLNKQSNADHPTSTSRYNDEEINDAIKILNENIIGTSKGNENMNELANMGKEANAGMVRDDSSTSTRLLDKNWSPLIVRKYQMHGWPLFIGMICDANLNDLDTLIYEIDKDAVKLGFTDGKIQSARNYAGYMSDRIVKHYNSIKVGVTEGVMVFWYIDKMAIASAYGDLMTHYKCAQEFYSIVNTLPHI